MKKMRSSPFFYVVLFFFCFLGGRCAAATQAHGTLLPASATSVPEKTALLAVVIDDFGYGGEGEVEMLALSIPFTGAVLPFSQEAQPIAQRLEEAGKEVFIHMPMEATSGHPEWVGSGGIFRSMSQEEIQATLNNAFTILPNATGMNNHMGSAILENEGALHTIFDALRAKDMFFLDSKTTANSLGKEVAQAEDVVCLERDVFLDSTDSLEKVKQNLETAAEVALENGHCIAIGHVGPEGGKITATALADLAPSFEERGIVFVTMSELTARMNEIINVSK